eukprot:COSAG05_NODE_11385_length_516_cov_0.661871_1_plen_139_part_00
MLLIVRIQHTRLLGWCRLLAQIEAVKHHPSIVGWYIADEPDGTTGTPSQWDERVAVMTKVTVTIHKHDDRPTVACLLSLPWYIGSTWQLFLNATDQVWIDLYEDPPGSARTWNATLFPQSHHCEEEQLAESSACNRRR